MKKKRYWLHYYSQRQHGADEAIADNTVSDKSPATFLHYLINEFPDNENRMMWSVEISVAEFRKLDGHL